MGYTDVGRAVGSVGLPVLHVVCTEAGNWALEVAASKAETGKDKLDVAVCKAADRDETTDWFTFATVRSGRISLTSDVLADKTHVQFAMKILSEKVLLICQYLWYY